MVCEVVADRSSTVSVAVTVADAVVVVVTVAVAVDWCSCLFSDIWVAREFRRSYLRAR